MSNAFILKITDASYVREHILKLTFNNGEERLCDFLPLSTKGICTKLQDITYFKAFRLDPFSVDWNDEIGFAPEFLYSQSIPLGEVKRDYPDAEESILKIAED